MAGLNETILYAAMKILTEIEYVDVLSKQTKIIKLSGCAGYIPVFKTLKEAKKYTLKGTYKTMLVRVGE